jgi:uncharacterized protein YeaO (DUF488 family)
MTHYDIKRIYDPVTSNDGYRVLVDRLWPRGVSKEKAELDQWAKDVAPSPELRKYFNHEEEKFKEFSKRYKSELHNNDAAHEFKQAMSKQKHVTLLYGAKDPKINHAIVLIQWLSQ